MQRHLVRSIANDNTRLTANGVSGRKDPLLSRWHAKLAITRADGGFALSTTQLTLAEIFSIAHGVLIKAGANKENADAVVNTVMRAERDGSVNPSNLAIGPIVSARKLRARLL